MEENTEEENKDIYEYFKEILWAQDFLIDKDNKIIKDNDQETIFHQGGDSSILRFRVFNRDTRDVVQRSCVELLEFDNDIKPSEIIEFWSGGQTGGGYCISYNYPVFQKILQIKERNITKIKVSRAFVGIKKKKGVLSIPFSIYTEIKQRADLIESQGTTSKEALKRYLINNAIFDFLNVKIRPTTTISRGDFKFFVDRSNLQSKKERKNFDEFLNEEDITALGEMFMKMVKKEVFPKGYLKKLDAYFIKENLEKIIKIGRQIMALKSEDIKTEKARRIVRKIKNIGAIDQMETLWQKYFEEYLLYLIFSYKKIIPKIELKDFKGIENKPDFVGINHYGGVDIIEIKTHLKDVLVWDDSHKNFAFSSEMSKAIIQTINYIDGVSRENFKNPKEKKELLEDIEEKENLYHPRGIIIISSKERIFKGKKEIDKDRLERDFTKLRNSIQNIQILTFDEILDMAERYSENIANNYEN